MDPDLARRRCSVGLFGASDTIPAPKTTRVGSEDGVILRRMDYVYTHAVSGANKADVRDAVEQTFRWEVVKEETPNAVTFRVYAAPATTPTTRAKLIRLIEGGVKVASAAVETAQKFSEAVNPFDYLVNKLGGGSLVRTIVILLVLAVVALLLLAYALPRIRG